MPQPKQSKQSRPPRPLVIAYHLIWTTYGAWLPNDPRGSGSHVVTSQVLRDLGEIHHGRKRVQPAGQVIRDFYTQAAGKLNHAVQVFKQDQFQPIARAFEQVMTQRKYTCYACAIMPDHVHILIRKHRDDAEMMSEQLKTQSAVCLREAKVCPPDHPVWASGHGWKVFLYHPDEVQRTMGYIQDNPLKSRLPAQAWPFVTVYDRWPLHPGHSPRSPYVRGLEALNRKRF